MENTRKSNPLLLLIFLIILIVLVTKVFAYNKIKPDPNLYQVVLTENDQAFYGKLHAINSSYPYLTDVYYLKPQDNKELFTVIKRGFDEMHAPTDKLYISKENILYWENVGADSRVANGIAADKDFRAGNVNELPDDSEKNEQSQ